MSGRDIVNKTSIQELIDLIARFRDERDWKQFHDPKNMAIALSIETSELLEHFLWRNKEESERRVIEKRDQISQEIADISIYLFELVDNLGIDLADVVRRKLLANTQKYPVEKAWGRSEKSSELK
jgi:dCTP diphosphatase